MVDQRRAILQGRQHVDDGFERLVFHYDEFHRVLGPIAVLGDDAGDGIALEADLVDGQRRHFHRLQALDWRRQAQVGGPLGQLASRHHGDDTGRRARRLGIDRENAGMGIGRAHEAGVQRSRNFNVVEEARRPDQQPSVFGPWDGLADDGEIVDFGVVHQAASPPPARMTAAAFKIALTMFW